MLCRKVGIKGYLRDITSDLECLTKVFIPNPSDSGITSTLSGDVPQLELCLRT